MRKLTLVLGVVALLATSCRNSNTSSEVTNSTLVDSLPIDSTSVDTTVVDSVK